MIEPGAPVAEEEVLTFVRATIASVWELELLLLLYRSPQKRWSAKEINRELRASETIVSSALRRLRVAGVEAEPARDEFQYLPASPRTHQIVTALETAYRTNPISVIKAILGAPDQKLRIFSDAFRLKE
jgi:biotin operon repressor